MQNPALSIELGEHKEPSIWPWVIGTIAAVCLFLSVRTNLNTIPDSLISQTQAIAGQYGANTIDIGINGRDITLSGTLSQDVDRNLMVAKIDSIPGVRVVVDDMKEFDPAEQARLEQFGFKQAIASIDLTNVSFEAGSTSLTSASRAPLQKLGQILKAYPMYRVRVAGHTDNTGRAEINLRISRDRARAVANFLISNGVNANQIIAQGYGATRPIADNGSEVGRAANRRIEINYVN